MEKESVEAFIGKKTRQIFGEEFIVNRMKRLLGGAQKHVYLAETGNGFCFVIYLWDKSTTYFSYEEDLFSSSSAKLFEENNKLMKQYDVDTPKLYYMDRSRREQEYDYAFVEYIDGMDMDEITSKYPGRLPDVLDSLKSNIEKLHNVKSNYAGQLNHLQTTEFDIVDYTFQWAKKSIDFLKQNDVEKEVLYSKIADILYQLSQGLKKREEYTFIHGELGPNHVMVDKNNRTFLIDIEGAKYCDLEEEASFLKIRFGDNYNKLVKKKTEEKRLEFYHLCHCVGLLSGAMELKMKDYYDMEDVNGMIEHFQAQLKKQV